ncbi:OPSD1-like protein [Mya arenaria]|uniref:OPSD1-like protein n=1 Tax=Mya arenaria TaxID=6604 RepID=A0ABY7DEQ2_MYAAR|nr:OPSD1-like protein [Mya arenaria]
MDSTTELSVVTFTSTSALLLTDVTTEVGIDVTTHIFDTYNVFIHPHWKQFPLVSDAWHYTVACEFYGLIGGIFGIMSINTMVMIAIDRYMAIARPIHVAKSMTRKKAFIMIVTVWIWSLATCLPPIFGWGRYIPEGFQTSCTFDYLTRTDNNRTYIFFLYVLGFAVPLSIIITCYALILRAVNKHEIEMKKTAKKMNAEIRTNQEDKRMEIKVAKIAMTILVLYLLSWTPYATVALIGQFGNAKFVTPFWSEIPVLFAKASAMHNPLVYALSHPKFRAAIQGRVPWLLCCCEPEVAKYAGRASTDRDRNTSRRSTASVAGGTSFDSEMSNLSDVTTADIDFRLRKLEEKSVKTNKSSRRNAIRSKSVEDIDDIPAGRIIQDLTHALCEVASRDKQGTRPLYLPTNVIQKDGASGQASKHTSDGVFVLDSSNLPELAKYLVQFSELNRPSSGNVNRAMDMSSEAPGEHKAGDGGAIPKQRVNAGNNSETDEAKF